MPRIIFFSSGNINIASTRLRILSIMKFIPNTIITKNINDIRRDDIVVLPKTQDLKTVKEIKNRCRVLIWDVCDNYFQDYRRNIALEILNICNIVVCPTPEMKYEILKINENKTVYVIEDPVYYDLKSPSFFKNKDKLNILWYGNDSSLRNTNWDKLVFEPISKNSNRLPKINFTFMMNNPSIPKGNEKIKTNFIKWSIRNQEAASTSSDIILLPLNYKDNEIVKVKSHNKLIDGIACGTIVLASPQPSYLKFKDYCFIGDNFVENILYCIENESQVIKRIHNCQKYIIENFTPEKMSKKWMELFQPYILKKEKL